MKNLLFFAIGLSLMFSIATLHAEDAHQHIKERVLKEIEHDKWMLKYIEVEADHVKQTLRIIMIVNVKEEEEKKRTAIGIIPINGNLYFAQGAFPTPDPIIVVGKGKDFKNDHKVFEFDASELLVYGKHAFIKHNAFFEAPTKKNLKKFKSAVDEAMILAKSINDTLVADKDLSDKQKAAISQRFKTSLSAFGLKPIKDE